MRETKLKRLILGIGIGTFVLLVAIVLVWKLKFYDTVNTEIAKQQDDYEKQKTKAEALPTAYQDRLKAYQKKQFAQAQLDYLRLRFRSLSLDLTSDGATEATFARYQDEYFQGYGLALRQQLLNVANSSGVQLETKAAVNNPPQRPEEVKEAQFYPASGFLKPLTSGFLDMKVTGSYENILNFLERINRSEILMSLSNIKLAKGTAAGTTGGAPAGSAPGVASAATTTGTDGDSITASFTVTPYLLTTGPSAQVGTPPAPAGTAPAATDPNAPPGTQTGITPPTAP